MRNVRRPTAQGRQTFRSIVRDWRPKLYFSPEEIGLLHARTPSRKTNVAPIANLIRNMHAAQFRSSAPSTIAAVEWYVIGVLIGLRSLTRRSDVHAVHEIAQRCDDAVLDDQRIAVQSTRRRPSRIGIEVKRQH
jgi:hypothetical protein